MQTPLLLPPRARSLAASLATKRLHGENTTQCYKQSGGGPQLMREDTEDTDEDEDSEPE